MDVSFTIPTLANMLSKIPILSTIRLLIDFFIGGAQDTLDIKRDSQEIQSCQERLELNPKKLEAMMKWREIEAARSLDGGVHANEHFKSETQHAEPDRRRRLRVKIDLGRSALALFVAAALVVIVGALVQWVYPWIVANKAVIEQWLPSSSSFQALWVAMALLLVGLCLYWFKLAFRYWYGFAEVLVALFAGAQWFLQIVTFSLKDLIACATVLYIVVRGLDNMRESKKAERNAGEVKSAISTETIFK